MDESSTAATTTDESSTSSDDSDSSSSSTGGDDCQGITASGGVGMGGVLHDFLAPDQNGAMHTLYQHCKQGVAMVISTEWCGPCNDEAPMLQEKYARYKDKGVVTITLMVQNDDGSASDAATAKRWADKHGLEHPVVAADERKIQDYWNPLDGYPSFKVLKTGIVVAASDPFPLSDSDLDGIVP